ncbi:MAG: hypothetical protein NC543_03890 [bacterium]|nr:hypothetical protein [bacterium]MCM1373799.1 hypothetical protein [Muribaculum sp.]
MKQGYKYILIGISLFVLVLLVLWLFVLRPLPRRQKVSACTLEGDVIEVELDITLCRHLFRSPTLRGTIEIDGVAYRSIHDIYPKNSVKVSEGIHIFLIPEQYALDTWENDRIYLTLTENRLESFMLSFVQAEETYTYFGPAASQAEAQEVAAKYVNR